uniref:Ycf21 n=1 Tax=Ptilothamnion sphaericum TaxID=1498216 RepID=A0A4D6WZZ8_9FLOR|nr:hypothetical protein [Ptilothamnion sphaericum]
MHINTLHKFQYTLIIHKNKFQNIQYTNYIPNEWQLILINEGSFTKNLNCLTNVNTEIIMQQQYNHIKKRNLRCVWLENCIYTKLTFARSLWILTYKDNIYNQLNTNMPIGQSFISSNTEIFKQIEEIYYGYCAYIERYFHINQPIWGRKYILYYNYNTYAIIQEFFSPKIKDFFYIL